MLFCFVYNIQKPEYIKNARIRKMNEAGFLYIGGNY